MSGYKTKNISSFLMLFKEYIPNKYFSYFREATSSEKQFLLITSKLGEGKNLDSGCYASLGFGGKMVMNLVEGCFIRSLHHATNIFVYIDQPS